MQSVRRPVLVIVLLAAALAALPAAAHAARGACVVGQPGPGLRHLVRQGPSSATATRSTSTSRDDGTTRRAPHPHQRASRRWSSRPTLSHYRAGRLPCRRGDGPARAPDPPRQGPRAARGRGSRGACRAAGSCAPIAVKRRGGWPRHRHAAAARGPRAVVAELVGVRAEPATTASAPSGRGHRAPRPLRSRRVRCRTERRLAAEAVGQLGRRRRRHRQPVGRVGQDPQPRPGQRRAARRLVPARRRACAATCSRRRP